METAESKTQWFKNSISFKLLVIGFLVLILLIPSAMIKNLVTERQQRMRDTEAEVTSKWGNAQSISGLVLTVPCEYLVTENKVTSYRVSYLNILPDKLDVKVKLIPETRYRGIFKVTVYRSVMEISGKFDTIKPEEGLINNCNMLWDKAFVVAGIADPRGINENVKFNINGTNLNARPGTMNSPLFQSGISTPYAVKIGDKIDFSFQLDLNGSGMFSVLPLGMETKVDMISDWAHPQFDGAFLPDSRHVTDTGFTAHWKILEHNRNIPHQSFGEITLYDSAFGVQLIKPVDIYQTSTRAVKYSVLFIILTFLVFFFTEVLVKKRAHPVQYLMAGAALCIFFSLLIALSEHTGFNLAYLIASTVIVLMTTLYAHTVFKMPKVSIIVCGVLAVLFSFLFVVLQLEDYSLLFGNIGLVVILGVVMFVSRKVDWFNDKKVQEQN